MGASKLSGAFGRVLRRCRQDAGFSQEALALEAEIDRSFVSLLERGQRQPTLETVFRLARVLKVNPAILINRTTAELD
jgi:transcriptional regulator with XRE-family HTH domain